MEINKLLNKQEELDNNIIANMKLGEMRKDFLFTNRVLALIVELGEFANEIRTFKHWSVKPQSDDQVILEEYVDCLHFLLSITLAFDDSSLGATLNRVVGAYGDDRLAKLSWVSGLPHNQVMNTTLLSLTSMASELYYNFYEDGEMSKNILVDLWDSFIFLGLTQGFTLDAIEEAYYKKNKVNFKRQESGY